MSLKRAQGQRIAGAGIEQVAANDELHQRLVRVSEPEETALASFSEPSCWDYKTEPAVSQSRESTTSPPAAAGSFRMDSRRWRRPTFALGMAAFVILSVTSCSNGSPIASDVSVSGQSPSVESSQAAEGSDESEKPSKLIEPEVKSEAPRVNTTKEPKDAAEQPKPSVQPSEEPTPDVSEEASFSGVAFEPGKAGPQAIERPGEAVSEGERIEADIDAQTNHADYADGVSIAVRQSDKGTVQSEGPGYLTGAPYKVFEIVVDNKGAEKLDLSSVFVTLSLGKKNHIALPVYGEVEAYDFSGVLSKGEKATSSYAFVVPKGSKAAHLSVDLDASHVAAVFDAKVR